MRRYVAKLLCSTLLAAVSISAQQSSSITVKGTVVEKSSGTPIRRALVSLVPAELLLNATESLEKGDDQGISARTTLTNSNGEFEIAGVLTGTYGITAARKGYLGAAIGSVASQQLPAPISIRSGTISAFRISMSRPAVISGTVADLDGELLDYGIVEALMVTETAQGRAYRVATSSWINDLGEYRLSNLHQGSYIVRFKSGPRPNNGNISSAAEDSRKDVTTYFPSTTSPTDSQILRVQEGDNVAGIHLTIRRDATFNVSGRLLCQDGVSEYSAIQLWAAGEEPTSLVVSGNQIQVDGGYSLRGLAPGIYDLTFAAGRDGTLGTGTRQLEVSDRDIFGFDLHVPRGVPVRLDVTGDGVAPPTDAEVNVALTAIGLGVRASYVGQVRFEKTEILLDCTPGRYKVSLQPPTGYYVKKVRFGEKMIEGNEVEVFSESHLRVEIAQGGLKLSGTVADKMESEENDVYSLPGYVLAYRIGAGSSVGEVVVGLVGNDGAFSLDLLRQGTYGVVAVRTFDSKRLFLQGIPQGLLDISTITEVSGDRSVSVSVRVVGAERMYQLQSP